MFSTRTDIDRHYNTWARAVERARAEGRELLDLTVSNPTVAELPYPRDAIREALASREALEYAPEPFGLPAARWAVAEEMGVAADRVVLTASTSEAYGFLFALLCDPGDEVLVPAPSYPLLDMLARFSSVRLVPYRLAYDGEWHVDLGTVRAAVGERTRAIVTVHPNNPTGSFLKTDELETLAATGLPLISDEVFRRYPLCDDPRRAQTVLEARTAPLVFALGGLSKLAGLPQMKLGWMAAGGDDAHVTEALARLELIADAFLSPSTPVQIAAPRLLELGAETRAAIRARTRRNLDRLQRALGDTSATVLRAEGGWYAVLRLPDTRTEEGWVLELLERGVLVQPGWLYDFEQEPRAVVSLLTPERTLEAGLERMVSRLP